MSQAIRRRIVAIEGKLSPICRPAVPEYLGTPFVTFLNAKLGEAEAIQLQAKVISAITDIPFPNRSLRGLSNDELLLFEAYLRGLI